jgi:S1-C subfamily serine protease
MFTVGNEWRFTAERARPLLTGAGWTSATEILARSGPYFFEVSVWLTALAVFIVLSNCTAHADDIYDPHLHSPREYLAGRTLEVSLLGVRLREARGRLNSGASAPGLLIVAVREGSPAANAGLAARQERPQKRLSAFGSGDLIIAADGSRVTNLLDFANEIRDAQPGEIVYLTIVRAGMRKQVPVPIPTR